MGLKNVLKKLLKPFYNIAKRVINRVVDPKIEQNNQIFQQKIANLQADNRNLHFQINNLLFEYNKVLYNKKNKVRIVFLFQAASFWPSWESVYEAIRDDERFEMKFYLLNEAHREPSQMNSSQAFLENNHINYEEYSEEKLDIFNPHIVIMQTPYDNWHRTDKNNSQFFLKKGIRLIYIPYGIEISSSEESIRMQYNNEFCRNMWKIYTLSEEIKNEYDLHSKNIRHAATALGHPKFDAIYNRKKLTNLELKNRYKEKKIILLKVHFPRDMQITLEERKFITPDVRIYLQFLKESVVYTDSIVMFMPHPKFYDTMSEELKNEFAEVLKEEHIFNYTEDDYREGLYSADIIVCDRSAIMIEIGALNKPTMFFYNKEFLEPFTEALYPLINSYYPGNTLSDIHSFIQESLAGNDPKKEERMIAFKKVVPYYDGKCGQDIVEDIWKTIKKEEI